MSVAFVLYWELHEGRKEGVILFPSVLQENIIEVGNERSFFNLQVFAVHLCNNQKNISEVDCGFLCVMKQAGNEYPCWYFALTSADIGQAT